MINSIASIFNTAQTNRANREMAEYAYKKDLEMWNRTNAYNAPEAQMARLKNAGLNPNLVYGSGAVANTSGQMPKYNAPQQSYNIALPEVMNVLGQFQDLQVKQAQTNNLREQNRLIKANAMNAEFMAKNASRYYANRGWKMMNDRNLSELKEMDLRNSNILKWGGEPNTLAFLEGQRGGKLFDSQLSYQQGRVRAQEVGIANALRQGDLLEAKTDYQNKLNEWFLTKMFAGFGFQAASQVSKYVGKGALGKGMQQIPGKSFNQSKRDFESTTRNLGRFFN